MDDSRNKAYHFVAYTAVVLSLITIMSTCITLPMVHAYFTTLRIKVDADLRLCQMSAQEVLEEAQIYRQNKLSTAVTFTNYTHHQAKRQASACGNCCLPAVQGPPGKPGRNGRHGKLGPRGTVGFPGLPAQEVCQKGTEPPCKVCGPGKRGEPGAQGPPGYPGATGPAGINGAAGPLGPKGSRGEAGAPGIRGEPGLKGNPGFTPAPSPAWPGDPGPVGQDGSPGFPGPQGPKGVDARSGEPGLHGATGAPGAIGEPGIPGDQGPPGIDGQHGEPGICPKYCSKDGGIFFEDGTRRFLSFSALNKIQARQSRTSVSNA